MTNEERANIWCNNAKITVDSIIDGVTRRELNDHDRFVAKQSYLNACKWKDEQYKELIINKLKFYTEVYEYTTDNKFLFIINELKKFISEYFPDKNN